MGSYKEITGDLLNLFGFGEYDIIGHGANCHSLMGAGIAAQIKSRYPEAYYVDKFTKLKPFEKWGSLTYVTNGQGMIVNLYTQYNPGPNADITAIRMSLKKLNLLAQHINRNLIGLPCLGSGIGGLDFETQVKPIIQEELKDLNVTVVIWDKN